MGRETGIGWCDSTVNPTAGCDGCELWVPRRPEDRDDKSVRGGSCYAGNLHTRFQGVNKAYPKPFELPVVMPGRMEKAARWSDLAGTDRPDKPWLNGMPRMIFISDMADALSKSIEFDYLRSEIIDNVAGTPHVWLWLTKQPHRMAVFSNWLIAQGVKWPDNLVAMTSVTGAGSEARVQQLEAVRCKYRGVSAEPLRSCPDWAKVVRGSIDWLIIGGESRQGGNKLHPCDIAWISHGVMHASGSSIPVFVKQLGSEPYRCKLCSRCAGGSQSGMFLGLDCLHCHGEKVERVPIELPDTHGSDWKHWPDGWEVLSVREVPEEFRPAAAASPFALK